jgi:hypothetical protein
VANFQMADDSFKDTGAAPSWQVIASSQRIRPEHGLFVMPPSSPG